MGINMLGSAKYHTQNTPVRPSVSQPPGRGPVPGPGINHTWPREVLLEFVIVF